MWLPGTEYVVESKTKPVILFIPSGTGKTWRYAAESCSEKSEIGE